MNNQKQNRKIPELNVGAAPFVINTPNGRVTPGTVTQLPRPPAQLPRPPAQLPDLQTLLTGQRIPPVITPNTVQVPPVSTQETLLQRIQRKTGAIRNNMLANRSGIIREPVVQATETILVGTQPRPPAQLPDLMSLLPNQVSPVITPNTTQVSPLPVSNARARAQIQGKEGIIRDPFNGRIVDVILGQATRPNATLIALEGPQAAALQALRVPQPPIHIPVEAPIRLANVPLQERRVPVTLPVQQAPHGHTPALSPQPTPKSNHIQLIPLPTANPYLLLSLSTINEIARDRDIMLVGNREVRAAILSELDTILPEWRDEIRANNFMTFRRLNSNRIQYFGALHGIDMSKVTLNNQDDITTFIEVMICVRIGDEDNMRVIVHSTRRAILEAIVLYLGLDTNFISLIPLPQLQTSVLTNNIKNINQAELQGYVVRRRIISTHKYSAMLRRLYNSDNWNIIAVIAEHPMENVIIHLDTFSDDEIVNQFGIIVPLSYTGRIREYIMTNIVSYAPVLVRSDLEIQPAANLMFMGHAALRKYFTQLRDNEIFTNFNVYLAYNSRVELIDNIVSAVIKPTFFMPCPVIVTRSANSTTSISEFEVTDNTIFPIAFGVVSKYHTYEITELIGAFHRHGEDGFILFRHPENIDILFASEDVEKLLLLLRAFTPTKDITELITRITTGMSEVQERTRYDAEFINQFRRFNQENRQHIRKFLYDIFHIGMYMRRWKGPGYPYPMMEKETQIKADPNDIVTDLLQATKTFLEGDGKQIITFCMSLKVCEYSNGRIDIGNKEFSREWRDVLDAKRCIRQASTMFVGTAYHYLVVLFREQIPNFTVKNVDIIA